MGYTNYYQPAKPSPKVWVEFIAKVEAIYKRAAANGIVLTGCQQSPNPIADIESVWFNGDLSNNLDHETFGLEWGGEWGFCKTNRKPYDAVVKAVLITAKEMGIVSEWSFDGDEDEEEYKNALDLLK